MDYSIDPLQPDEQYSKYSNEKVVTKMRCQWFNINMMDGYTMDGHSNMF